MDCGSGSSLGIATELRAGRSGIESWWGRDFPPVRTGPGAHPASCTMGTESFPVVKCGRGVLLTTYPLLVTRLARHHPHRTHDLRSGSQDHHPSKNSIQKTICCNSTSNAPDDWRIYPKHVELRIHQWNYLVASNWNFRLSYSLFVPTHFGATAILRDLTKLLSKYNFTIINIF